MARLDPKPFPLEMTWEDTKDTDKLIRYEQSVWEKLQAAMLALPEGEVVGGVLTFPVADGKAVYLVTKAKPLTIQHVPLGDAYQIPSAYIRGLRLADVRDQIRRGKALAKLFTSRRMS